jgi:DMSO/TMAO reductase YedYZ molybdopterin-dependent catalytic subunit
MRRPGVAATVSLWILLSIGLEAAAQAGQAPAATRTNTLVVAGDVPKPATLALSELRALPRTTVGVQDEDGRTSTYEGVLVGELLKRAGAPLGNDLRGDAVATYVLVIANDGYRVVFSLAELDPDYTGSKIIVADTVDGKPLFDYQGPLRIVAPGDARGSRSIRMVERIEVVRLKR